MPGAPDPAVAEIEPPPEGPFDPDRLRPYLERLYRTYDARYLDSDPAAHVHRFSAPEDQEIVGLVASALAYGNVKSIQASVAGALDRLDGRPFAVVMAADAVELRKRFRGFYHRWSKGEDVACLLWFARGAIEATGSLGAFFTEGYAPEAPNIRSTLTRFIERLLGLDIGPFYRGQLPSPGGGVRDFLPSPETGSACKRLNLYLRWMVRPNDGLDLGLWKAISPAKLVMPIDTHIRRAAVALGLTERATADWRMAEEITGHLAKIDPADPVKYDFALMHLGMLSGKSSTSPSDPKP